MAVCIVLATSCSPPDQTSQSKPWPSKPITISCYAAPGGGTDLISRLVARTMAIELGVKINVVNRAAARGGAALNYVSSREHDGYNWAGISESMLPAPVLGVTESTAKDWTFFIVAGAPGVISVAEDSAYKTLDELIAAAKESPGMVKVSASLTGGIWHTKLLALEGAADVKFNFIPFNQGSQPSQMAALSGEVDAVLTSISEQAELIKGGKLRPLAMVEMASFDFPGLGTIAAAGDTYPAIEKLPVSQFLGFALPADTPEDILQVVAGAFEKIMLSPDIKQNAKKRLLKLQGAYGQEADDFAVNVESAWCWKLHEIGITEKSPEELGISRPK